MVRWKARPSSSTSPRAKRAPGRQPAAGRGQVASIAAQLWQYLGYLIGQGHRHIVLDLRGMTLIDSAGVDVLARVSAWIRRKGW
jgi:hypothetical protein